VGKKAEEVLESGRVEEVGRKDIGGESLRPALSQENKEIMDKGMEKSPERTAERAGRFFEEPGKAAASLFINITHFQEAVKLGEGVKSVKV
jgi:hypothetical protein